MVLWNVYHHINLSLMQHIQRLRVFAFIRGPEHLDVFHALLVEVFMRAACGIEDEAVADKLTGCIEHLGFLLCITRRKQDCLLRYLVSHREHRLDEGTGRVLTDTPYLTRGSHIDTQDGVCFLQAIEGELAGLYAHVVEVKEVL